MRGRDILWVMALIAGVWGLIGAVVFTVTSRPPAPGQRPLLAVFAPTADADAALSAIVASGAYALRPVVGGALWVVRADPDQVRRLRRAGAWAVFPPPPLGIVASGCAGLGVGRIHATPQGLGR